jgi:hypothetical protein
MTKKARPSRVKKSEHSEGLGRLFTRPPRPNRAQRDMHHPFAINGHVWFLGEQNRRIGQLPANPSAFLSFPVSFLNLSELERERERGGRQLTDWSCGAARGLLAGERGSPEGEHDSVERLCGGALSCDPCAQP